MAEPFLGEVRLMSFNFPPKGWALCNGQLLPINQNQGLFSLFGTTFGGDGRVTFGLPDFRDRVPVHMGAGHTMGERAGEAAHTLIISEMPAHQHFADGCSNVAADVVPTNNLLGKNAVDDLFSTTLQTPVTLAPQSISNVGGSQAHNNLQPYLAINFCVALQGIFPSQT